ncbi:hypothetical protein FISHEDRAFT_66994 [Fistulina hepatica ATCC 64428]|uniref:DUF3533 domain-containing protein n=1 Tax=Fistulina hepatica ATCC 64428 TaxID=1128425 RepID=A0A0D7A696_9AGAR|nr:hypothetical protein FISHEDRAFT_66994 [Fistulina hepatica ATCC 64428]
MSDQLTVNDGSRPLPQGTNQSATSLVNSAPSPPFSSRFLDKSPAATAARNAYLKVIVSGTFMIILVIFCVFSIYWGALWQLPAHQLPGWVVDFDGSTIGSAVSQALVQSSSGFSPTAINAIDWQVRSSSDFPGGPSDVANHVVDEKVWVAVTINSNATSNMMSAIASADSSYNGTNAITAYGVEARNENAYRELISPIIIATLSEICEDIALQVVSEHASFNITRVAIDAPVLLVQPIWYSIDNLRPFDIPVASAITFVGLIYMLILSFFILFYALLSRAFQVNFNSKFGHAGFIVFWMLNYVAMLALGIALESMITVLTVRFIPFFLTNVSIAFMPMEVLPHLYRYGYAWPFYNVSHGVRTVLFSTRNELGQNFGILIAWTVLSCITLPLFQWLVRRKEVNAARANVSVPMAERKNEQTEA